ncbi:MAG: hypothetical protein LAN63_11680 [Acidobacteriia bacterium]|nr:hypothetical protein [Terriglobia bacterium]
MAALPIASIGGGWPVHDAPTFEPGYGGTGAFGRIGSKAAQQSADVRSEGT